MSTKNKKSIKSAKILKEYAYAFTEVKTSAKKDASKVTENK